MRIVCPSCSASYEVAAKLIRKGRTARCARCRREWIIEGDDAGESEPLTAPPPAAAAPPIAAPPSPIAPVPFAAPEPPHRPHIPQLSLAALQTEPESRPEPAAPDPRHVALSPADPLAGVGPDPMGPVAWELNRASPVTATAWTAWIASVAVLVLLGWAAFTWRADIVHLWPPSERLYAALGLKVAPD